MSIFHCYISNISRASGSSACSTLAYISGEKVFDERTNKTYNFSHKDRILLTNTLLPDHAPENFKDAKILFNDIEKFETAINARTAKEIEVALPKELNLNEQVNCVENFIHDNLTCNGFCATYAMHNGGKNQNFHAHILIPNRALNSNGEWQTKQKMSYALDDNGNRIPKLDKFGNQKLDKHGRKQWKRICLDRNLLDDKNFLLSLRQNWANEVNKHLPSNLHIDHRSNAERGLTENPTIHEGYAARAIEQRGGFSDRCQLNRDIKNDNAQLKILHDDIIQKQIQLANLQSVPDSNSILLNAIAAALCQIGSGGIANLQGIFKKDYAELLRNASSPEEVAKILAEIESLCAGIEPVGGSLAFNNLENEFERERDLDERFKKFKQRRRIDDGVRISSERLRTVTTTESKITTGLSDFATTQSGHSTTNSHHSESANRDYVAELLDFRRKKELRRLAQSERTTSQSCQERTTTQTAELKSADSNQSATTPAITKEPRVTKLQRPKRTRNSGSQSKTSGFSR